MLIGPIQSHEYFFRFDVDHLFRFTLTVKKNYRVVPYHNWAHAFSVAHAMYTVVKTTSHKFSPLEVRKFYAIVLCTYAYYSLKIIGSVKITMQMYLAGRSVYLLLEFPSILCHGPQQMTKKDQWCTNFLVLVLLT